MNRPWPVFFVRGVKFGLSLLKHADAKIVFVQLAAIMVNELSSELRPKLAAIREGDHGSFLEVYELMHAKLFRFFLKRVLLHDTAKDLTQQSFIRLWQFRHTLSDLHPLEKQIFIIARSLLINHVKKEATQQKLKAAAGRAFVEAVAPAGEEVSDRKSQVSAAIDTLPPVRKRIIILKTFHGFSNKEIAHQLKISVKTVEDHVTKAFRHIRQVVAVLVLFFFF
jgi:RNA polymerase sigma factor (sigma-70 family)